jgi:hypothetical protein
MIVKNFLPPSACQSSNKILSLNLKICKRLAIFQGDGSTKCMGKIALTDLMHDPSEQVKY